MRNAFRTMRAMDFESAKGDVMNTAFRNRRSGGSMLQLTVLLVFVLAALGVAPCLAGETAELIQLNDVTSAAIVKALKAGGIDDVSLDDDGDARVKMEDRTFWMRGNPKQSHIYAMAYRSFASSVPLGKKLLLVNAINDGLSVVRASMTKSGDRLWLDYSFLTEEGVTAAQIVNVAKRFNSLLNAIDRRDEDRILR